MLSPEPGLGGDLYTDPRPLGVQGDGDALPHAAPLPADTQETLLLVTGGKEVTRVT